MQASQNTIRIWLMLVIVAGWVGFVGCKKVMSIRSHRRHRPAGEWPGRRHAHKVYIGVSLLTLTNPFFKDIADTLQAEGQKRGYEVVVTAGELDPAKQKDQVKDFLVHKASA